MQTVGASRTAPCRPPCTPFAGPPGRCRRTALPLAAAAAVPQRAAEHEASQLPEAGVVPAMLGRRSALLALSAGIAALAGSAPAALAAGKARGDSGDWSSPGLAAPVDESQPKFFKTASGVKVQLLAEGAGPAASAGDVVLVDFVLRRSNGYFIYGTTEGVSFQPKDVPVGPVALKLGDGSTVPGLEEALLGLRPGSKLRALVPPEQGYQAHPGSLPEMPTFATKRQLENHKSEPLLFEVQLLRVGGIK